MAASDAAVGADAPPAAAGETPSHVSWILSHAAALGAAREAKGPVGSSRPLDPATVVRAITGLETIKQPADTPAKAMAYLAALHLVICTCPQREALPWVKMLVEDAGVDIHAFLSLDEFFATLSRRRREELRDIISEVPSNLCKLTRVIHAQEEEEFLDSVDAPPRMESKSSDATWLAESRTASTDVRLRPAHRSLDGASHSTAHTHTHTYDIRAPPPPRISAGGATRFALMDGKRGADAAAHTHGNPVDIVNALMAAAVVGAGAVLLYLVSRGARPNMRDACGSNALHFAVVASQLEIAKLLVKVGVDVEQPDNEGLRPLHTATACHEPDMVTLLLKLGANVNGIDEITGLTPIHTATDAATLQALLKACEAREAGRREGLIPLVEGTPAADAAVAAAAAGSRKPPALITAEEEAKFAPIVDKLSIRGWTPLYASAYVGQTSCMRLLLSAGANPNAVTDAGETPLHAACRSGVYAAVEMLINAGSKVNVVSKAASTPFHVGAHLNDFADICGLLYRSGARLCCATLAPPRRCTKCRVALRRVQTPALADTASADRVEAAQLADSELEELLKEESTKPAPTPAKSRRDARKDRKKRAKDGHAARSVPVAADDAAAASANTSGGRDESPHAAAPTTADADSDGDDGEGPPPLVRLISGAADSAHSTPSQETAADDSVLADAEGEDEWPDFQSAVAAMSVTSAGAAADRTSPNETPPRAAPSLPPRAASEPGPPGHDVSSGLAQLQSAPDGAVQPTSASDVAPTSHSWFHPALQSTGRAVPTAAPRFASTLGGGAAGPRGIGIGSGLNPSAVMAMAGLGLATRMTAAARSPSQQ